MISVYDIGNEAFTKNGDAVLDPTETTLKQVAGGSYDLSMNHPIDPEGKWKHLVPGAVIRCPVPEETIESAVTGYDADVYRTTGEAALRDGTTEPSTITYPTWSQYNHYSVGSRVQQQVGSVWHNYECIYWDANSIYRGNAPSSLPEWWKEIPRSTPGSTVLATLPAGTEVYLLEDLGNGWYKVSTFYGLEGYIKGSQLEFVRHMSEEDTKPRHITEQLFRIMEAQVDTKAHSVTVSASHVSYDLAGNLIQNVKVTQVTPAMAIGQIVGGLMIPYRGAIATNLTDSSLPKYDGEFKGKNGTFALLDPDNGVAAKYNAKVSRDNWDIFIMNDVEVDRGFRLEYRQNMKGVTWKRNSSSLITRVVPVAKDASGEDLYLPEKWVDSTHINDYPVIRMERLKVDGQIGKAKTEGGTDNWTESDLLDEMRAKASERYSVDKVDIVTEEVTVDFVMMGDTYEYQHLKDLETVLLYDTVKVTNETIGLSKKLQVTELQWNAIRMRVTGLKLTNRKETARTVTGYNVQNSSIGKGKLSDEVKQEIIDEVKDMVPNYTDPGAARPSSNAGNIWYINTSLNSTAQTSYARLVDQWSAFISYVQSLTGSTSGYVIVNGLISFPAYSGSSNLGTFYAWGVLALGDGIGTMFMTHYHNGEVYLVKMHSGTHEEYQLDRTTL